MSKLSPWSWIPTLYVAEGVPYFAVNVLSLVMFKNMGLPNSDIALYVSWLSLPWVIKPFWSPVVDMFGTKRSWVYILQFFIAVLFALVAFAIPTSFFIQSALALLALCAFSSATHDIAADGFYIVVLSPGEQSFFVGIRSTFYRLSTIFCQGGLVIMAGKLEQIYGVIPAWQITFAVMAVLFALFAVWHLFFLPKCDGDKAVPTASCVEMMVGEDKVVKRSGTFSSLCSLFMSAFVSFFAKFGRKDTIIMLLFIFSYRLGEAQLSKMVTPFLMDSPDVGGLGMSTIQLGVSYGTIGVVALTLGGILGGLLVSKSGLKAWLWPMLIAMNVPNIGYVFLSMCNEPSIILINIIIAIEQFGYGFGFTSFMLYLIYVSKGEFSTSHYAICTGLMALGMMLPGMVAGYIQEYMGYHNFFIWVCLCTIPAFVIAKFLNIDSEFGKK